MVLERNDNKECVPSRFLALLHVFVFFFVFVLFVCLSFGVVEVKRRYKKLCFLPVSSEELAKQGARDKKRRKNWNNWNLQIPCSCRIRLVSTAQSIQCMLLLTKSKAQ